MILPQLSNGQPASSCGFLDQTGRRCLQEIARGGATSCQAEEPPEGAGLFEVGGEQSHRGPGIPSGRTPLRCCSLPAPHLAAETIAFQGAGG